MRSRSVRVVSACVVLVLALAPASALAAPARPLAQQARTLMTGVPSYPADAYDTGDDTPAGARDLTARVAGDNAPNGFGKPAYEEAHAFSAASDESTYGAADYKWDEDWFKFNASSIDVMMGKPFLIEAQPGNAWVAPVIEVYGPALSPADVAATPPPASITAEGFGKPDAKAVAGNDYGEWTLGMSASLSFVPTSAGEYYVRIRPLFDASGMLESPQLPRGFNPYVGAGPYTLRFKAGEVTRLAGAGRVQTAIALSKERYPDGMLSLFDLTGSGGTVVVASGWNFPDALAGSTLAAAVGGPLLLTHDTALDTDVRDEIARLAAKRVFVLGSSAAVADGVVRSLEGIPGLGAGKVVRVAGAGRVQTAARIAEQVKTEVGSTASLAFVADGWNYPDALACSPMAAYNYAPILLTHQGYLDSDTLSEIKSLGITDVVILGSTVAVGAGVESKLKSQLNADGKEHVLRLGGADRYETAAKIAAWETGDKGASLVAGTPGMAEKDLLEALDPSRVAVAAGWNYPDALGGGAFAGLAGYPLLLTKQESLTPRVFDPQSTLPAGSAFFSLTTAGRFPVAQARRSYLIGGSAAVADSALITLDKAIGSAPKK